MPDWFYRTISRPVLFRMSARRARDLALSVMGGLSRVPLGGTVIELLGHMKPDPRLVVRLGDLELCSPLGLGPALDLRACALPAFTRFGFGFVEVGPIFVNGSRFGPNIARNDAAEALLVSGAGLSLEAFLPRAREAANLGTPIFARLGSASDCTPEVASKQCTEMISALAPHVKAFTLATLRDSLAWSTDHWRQHVIELRKQCEAMLLLLVVPVELDQEERIAEALNAGFDGLVLDGARQSEEALLIGGPIRDPALARVRALRARFPKTTIVAAGGVHEPEDALALRAAGADFVEIDTGMVFTGPGLAKRINELFLVTAVQVAPIEPHRRAAEMSWFWTAAMGAGMVFGSVLALLFAATVVVLPYDLDFIGMTREELDALNPHLLHFMAHDRVSLAGTMVATGVMYLGLSIGGSKRGYAWARHTIFASAFTGFASFFLFLGFGYLDPFHAFVTVALLQLLLLGVYAKPGEYAPVVAPERRGDRAWRLGLWGQLLLIIHGAGLLGAGAIISVIGVTHVFVPEDLAYMNTSAEALSSAHPRLIPLIAHDRATFGGMLLASGWAFILPAMWGVRRGENWLWWTYMASGPIAYTAAIGVHYAVCYTDFRHLLPAFAGLGLFLLGMLLSAPYLGATEPQAEKSKCGLRSQAAVDD